MTLATNERREEMTVRGGVSIKEMRLLKGCETLCERDNYLLAD
ncbi:MAG: hypothetical protein QOH25_4039 [Acidobacteriota bacterium]|jgi:hypothetical protein|nr:hypothetical protein [Acidobacteriota bacterium]